MIRRAHICNAWQVQINALKSHMYDMNVCDARARAFSIVVFITNTFALLANTFEVVVVVVAALRLYIQWMHLHIGATHHTSTRVKILRISNILRSLYTVCYTLQKYCAKKKIKCNFWFSDSQTRDNFKDTTYTVQKEMSCASSPASVP